MSLLLSSVLNDSSWLPVGLLTSTRVSVYPLTFYYPSSKIDNRYPRKQRGKEKLTEDEQEDHSRDERLTKLTGPDLGVSQVGGCLYTAANFAIFRGGTSKTTIF